MSIGAHCFNLVNVYAPDCLGLFFRDLHNYFLSPIRTVAGNFNCIDNARDRLHFVSGSLRDQSTFRNFLSDRSLIDIWRKQNPFGTLHTWANASYSQASRLDRFLVSAVLSLITIS